MNFKVSRCEVLHADNAIAEHRTVAGYEHAGGATITRVMFGYKGIMHVAVRFWRHDLGTSGVELYTMCAGDEGEAFLRYAKPEGGTFLDRLATRLIDTARQAFDIPPDTSERAALVEWSA